MRKLALLAIPLIFVPLLIYIPFRETFPFPKIIRTILFSVMMLGAAMVPVLRFLVGIAEHARGPLSEKSFLEDSLEFLEDRVLKFKLSHEACIYFRRFPIFSGRFSARNRFHRKLVKNLLRKDPLLKDELRVLFSFKRLPKEFQEIMLNS